MLRGISEQASQGRDVQEYVMQIFSQGADRGDSGRREGEQWETGTEIGNQRSSSGSDAELGDSEQGHAKEYVHRTPGLMKWMIMDLLVNNRPLRGS